ALRFRLRILPGAWRRQYTSGWFLTIHLWYTHTEIANCTGNVPQLSRSTSRRISSARYTPHIGLAPGHSSSPRTIDPGARFLRHASWHSETSFAEDSKDPV